MQVAVAMCGYALFTFVWRAKLIARKTVGQFDDRVGPLGLCGAVVLALSTILIISVVDLVDMLEHSKGHKPGAAALRL